MTDWDEYHRRRREARANANPYGIYLEEGNHGVVGQGLQRQKGMDRALGEVLSQRGDIFQQGGLDNAAAAAASRGVWGLQRNQTQNLGRADQRERALMDQQLGMIRGHNQNRMQNLVGFYDRSNIEHLGDLAVGQGIFDYNQAVNAARSQRNAQLAGDAINTAGAVAQWASQ